MTLYKPRCLFQVDVPADNGKNFSKERRIELYPAVQEMKWTKNSHLVADELTVTLNYRDCGIDPRILRNGRGALWVWDDAFEAFNKDDHFRFQGVVTQATRKGTGDSMTVDLTLLDYTTFFINMRPFPSDGYPDWTDSIKSAWNKILKYTGYRDPSDPEGKRVISSVYDAFKNGLDVRDPSEKITEDTIIGSIVPDRFHAISKPSFPNRCDAWAAWQWLMGALGLVSYIDKTKCVVTTTSEFYKGTTAGLFAWAHNIREFEETVDSAVTNIGIHLTSFNYERMQVIESFFPDPSDETIKKTQAAAKRIAKGTSIAENEEAVQYMPFECHEIQTQEGLDTKARAVYEEFKRQELTGKLSTSEMRVFGAGDGFERDLLSYSAGDALVIRVDDYTYDSLKDIQGEDARVEYLKSQGHPENLAQAIARNFGQNQFFLPVFHIEQLEVTINPDRYDCEIKFHNIILDDGQTHNLFELPADQANLFELPADQGPRKVDPSDSGY